MNYKKMLTSGVKKDGLRFCLDALQEECGELITAISHHRRGRKDDTHLILEMADVQIMLDMCRIGIDNEVGFAREIKRKAQKLRDIIKFKPVPEPKIRRKWKS